MRHSYNPSRGLPSFRALSLTSVIKQLAAHIIIYLIYAILLSACSNSKIPPGSYEFGTLITEDGLKLFELRYPLPQREFRPVAHSQQTRAHRNPHEKSERLALDYLQTQLETTGYCREGYMFLGRHAGLTAQRIRGECKERANQQDREQFKNTIVQW